MILPDALVYASIVPLAGAAVKTCQWFIQDVISRNKRNNGIETTVEGKPPPTPTLGLGDYQQIGTLLKNELNGRYMMAQEARSKFQELNERIDELKIFMAAELSKLSTGASARGSMLDRIRRDQFEH